MKHSIFPKRRTAKICTVIIIICLILLFPPFIDWASRIEPIILGLPFFMFYTLFFSLIISVALIVDYRDQYKRNTNG